ncbi:MAG: RluA family pseudouridine synthase [Oscillospiraceae bacterium]|nr:RluA family pseudouridine synthase [Oscillospiraceae bacterium]
MKLIADREGERIDAAVARISGELSRAAAQKLMEQGFVTVGGVQVKKNYKVSEGDTIEVALPEVQDVGLQAEDIALDVVYEDADVIVVNKPKGLVVHPAPGHSGGTLVNALMFHCGDSLSGIGGELRPGIVHRIDKDTSGLILAAKNDAAHRDLAAQLKTHTMARTYECLAVGSFREDSGTVDAPIGRSEKDRKKMAIRADGRNAVTHWQVLGRYRGYTHLRCYLETGRTHQIRVHLASIGHPIVGDTVYGKAALGFDSQCLHAVGLQFRHPRTQETIRLTCPLPPDFAAALEKLKRQGDA